jgi:hypothetical protein
MGKWYADTQFRRPDQETIKTQRGRIRQLMVEKDAYTRKYLDEKKKYDHLLARVNSTSTLGSISLHNATTDPTVYHTLSPGGGIVVEPEASSASIDRANHLPSSVCSAVTNTPPVSHGNGIISDDDGRPPFRASVDSIAECHVTLGAANQKDQNSSSTNIDPSDEGIPQLDPQLRRSVSPQVRPRAPGHASESFMRKRLRAARKRLAKDSRQVAARAVRGAATGIILYVGAVVFFPVTIGYVVRNWRLSRRRLHLGLDPWGPDVALCLGSDMPLYRYELSEGGYYDHRRFPGELPAVHELLGAGLGKVSDLLNRLTLGTGAAGFAVD